MKKLLTRAMPAAAVAALVLAPASPAAAAGGEPPRGLRCADIVDGAVVYTTQFGQTPPTVLAEAVLDRSACRQVRYSLVVFDEVGSTTPLVTLSGAATTDAAGRPVVRFEREIAQEAGDETLCVRFETRIGKRLLLDSAPDTGCAELLLDGAPPGRNFR